MYKHVCTCNIDQVNRSAEKLRMRRTCRTVEVSLRRMGLGVSTLRRYTVTSARLFTACQFLICCPLTRSFVWLSRDSVDSCVTGRKTAVTQFPFFNFSFHAKVDASGLPLGVKYGVSVAWCDVHVVKIHTIADSCHCINQKQTCLTCAYESMGRPSNTCTCSRTR